MDKLDSKTKKIFAFLIIILGFFMALLDTTIVNISLPKMANYFSTSVQDITWVVNSYNIAFIVLMITASRLADQFGRKKLFVAGLVLFTITSCLVGFSKTYEMVILFRVLQGLSAAIVVPVTVPLILDVVSIKKIGLVIGVWGAVAGLAAACGPILGGILTHLFNWQAVFFVNLPIGIVAIVFSILVLNESYDKTASKYIDLPGMVTASIGILALVLGLLGAPEKGWTSTYVISLFIISLVALIIFITVELKSNDPMLPIWLMKSKSFSAASITLVFATSGLMAGSYMGAYYLIKVLELSQFTAGMTLIAMPISMMIVSAVSGPLTNKFGCKLLGVLGMFLTSLSVFTFGLIGENPSRTAVIWRLIILGCGLGMTISPVMGTAIKNAPIEKVGIASGITNLARSFGMVLGVAILATILSNNINVEIENAKQDVFGKIIMNTVISDDVKKSLIDDIKKTSFTNNDNLNINMDDSLVEVFLTDAMETWNSTNSIQSDSDKQRKEIKSILAEAQKEMGKSKNISFIDTFRIYSFILAIGCIFALFSDKSRKEKMLEAVSD